MVSDIFESIMCRLKRGIYFDVNLVPYDKEFLNKVLVFYQEEEMYENCVIIRNIINNFKHDDELNYKEYKIIKI